MRRRGWPYRSRKHVDRRCLLHDGNRLLLVNDDNKNPDQIGTQFVVLDLVFYPDDDTKPSSSSSSSSKKKKTTTRSSNDEVGLVVALAVAVAIAALLSVSYLRLWLGYSGYRRVRRGGGEETDPGADIVLSEQRGEIMLHPLPQGSGASVA